MGLNARRIFFSTDQLAGKLCGAAMQNPVGGHAESCGAASASALFFWLLYALSNMPARVISGVDDAGTSHTSDPEVVAGDATVWRGTAPPPPYLTSTSTSPPPPLHHPSSHYPTPEWSKPTSISLSKWASNPSAPKSPSTKPRAVTTSPPSSHKLHKLTPPSPGRDRVARQAPRNPARRAHQQLRTSSQLHHLHHPRHRPRRRR